MYIQHCVVFLQGIIFIFLHNEFGAMCPKKFKAIKIADNVIFKGNLITNTGVIKTADRPNVDELSCSDSMTFLKTFKTGSPRHLFPRGFFTFVIERSECFTYIQYCTCFYTAKRVSMG